MAPPFLAALDVDGNLDWDSLGSLRYIKHVLLTPSSEKKDIALDKVQYLFGKADLYVDVTKLKNVDDILEFLDAGTTAVVVRKAQLTQLKEIDNIDSRRIILSTDADISEDAVINLITEHDGPVMVSESQEITFHVFSNGESRENRPIYVRYSSMSSDYLTESMASNISISGRVPVVPSDAIIFDKKDAPGTSLSTNPRDGCRVVELLLARVQSDRPDGLFTTIVQDERGVSLGLVYSSKESVAESLRTGRGVYHSRKRGLWYKGESSGDIQELVHISLDCDHDCLCFTVRQLGRGFCHLGTESCFGGYKGLSKLQNTLKNRKESAPAGSYTSRLFNDHALLNAKIREEASELCEATEKDHIAFEAADLLYFALTKCVASGVSLEDIERKLDQKSLRVKRRKGDAKPKYLNGTSSSSNEASKAQNGHAGAPSPSSSAEKRVNDEPAKISMSRFHTSTDSPEVIQDKLQRPSQRSTNKNMEIAKDIIDDVQANGDKAVLSYTHKFEKATSLTSPVIKAPFPPRMMQLPPETIEAIDVSFRNIEKFHSAQKESKPLEVETMPGVVCSRFSRAIERVGLYVPGGTAVLPSTALMLGVPAMVAGCKKIVLATPPRKDGTVTPEIVYAAHKIGAESIVLAGGAQAVAAMAYGTESISKVDKILGPGNQFVTAGKMLVSNDTSAKVSIDMPAGPSEVLVVADKTSNPAFVAADLLSQAEHGVDSQVICIGVGLNHEQATAIEDELHRQASALPRVDIVRGAISHSSMIVVKDIQEAMHVSNEYAPEHLIIQTADAEAVSRLVENAGSVFIGPWTPESVGDYSAGVNHSLPTYGYARQYSGVNLGSYIKHITSSQLTKDGLRNVSGAVMQLAKVEELEAHRRAVEIRLRDHADRNQQLV